MKIINLPVNENLLQAKAALAQAASENIVELSRNYLLALDAYRDELYRLSKMPEINLSYGSAFGRELIEQSRNSVRAAIELTVRERNKTQALLDSLTVITGYQAAETFNQLKYKGFDDWEMRAGGVRSKDLSGGEQMTVQQAVETAGRLRREFYVASNKIENEL